MRSSIERRIEQLEQAEAAQSTERRPHIVFVTAACINDEGYGEAKRKALEANPPLWGAQVIIVAGVRAKEIPPEKVFPEIERPFAPVHILTAIPVGHEPMRDPPLPPTIRVWP